MGTCTHFLPRKGRPCRMATRAGSSVCGPHSSGYSATCAACGTALAPSAVKAHMRRCPRARTNAAAAASPWFSQDVNRPPVDEPPANSASPPAASTGQLIEPAIDPPPPDVAASTAADAIRARWGDSRTSYAKLEERHFEQGVALASLLRAADGSAVAEAGAGRAYVSLITAELLAAAGVRASFVAVDRGANRNKMDGALRLLAGRGEGVTCFTRARVDIRHLLLSGVPGFLESPHPRVVGKHLCGPATDAALKSADDFCRVWRAGKTAGCCRVVIAPCCRSVCDWDSLHGVADEWREAGGREAFQRAVGIAAWGLNRTEGKAKARLGKEARRMIDSARVRWLRRCGWDVRLVRYVGEGVTSENVAVVAEWDIVKMGGGQAGRDRQQTAVSADLCG